MHTQGDYTKTSIWTSQWAAAAAAVTDAWNPSRRSSADRPTTPQSNCNKSNNASPVSRDLHAQKRSSILLKGNTQNPVSVQASTRHRA